MLFQVSQLNAVLSNGGRSACASSACQTAAHDVTEFLGQSFTVLGAAVPGGRCALKESSLPPVRVLDRHQRLNGVARCIDVVGAGRDHPDNCAKDPHITTEHPNLAHLCNVGRSGVISEDGTQMVLDIRTRISLAAVEADEVAILLELSRHLRSVLLVPGDKNLLVQTVNWVIRRKSVGTGHTKQLLSSSLEVATN